MTHPGSGAGDHQLWGSIEGSSTRLAGTSNCNQDLGTTEIWVLPQRRRSLTKHWRDWSPDLFEDKALVNTRDNKEGAKKPQSLAGRKEPTRIQPLHEIWTKYCAGFLR